jgi:hypothetical protein
MSSGVLVGFVMAKERLLSSGTDDVAAMMKKLRPKEEDMDNVVFQEEARQSKGMSNGGIHN